MSARIAVIAVLALVVPLAARAAAACDRACLDGVVDTYLAALVAHDPARAPFAPGARFTENGQTLKLGESLWATAGGLGAYKLHFDDVAAGEAGFIGAVMENGHADLLSLRLKVKDGRIVEAETVVARPAVATFMKTDALTEKPIFSAVLPPAERRPRAALTATVTAYLHALTAAKAAPDLFADDCTRVEDGVVTANNPAAADRMGKLTCGGQLATGVSRSLTRIREPRMPLVDEERGLVHVVMLFDHAAVRDELTVHYADGMSDVIRYHSDYPFAYLCSELFRIEGGRVRQIEVVLTPVPYGMPSGWGGGAAVEGAR